MRNSHLSAFVLRSFIHLSAPLMDAAQEKRLIIGYPPRKLLCPPFGRTGTRLFSDSP